MKGKVHQDSLSFAVGIGAFDACDGLRRCVDSVNMTLLLGAFLLFERGGGGHLRGPLYGRIDVLKRLHRQKHQGMLWLYRSSRE